MNKPVTPSQLRQDIYRLIDQVLATREPLEIRSKGRRLRLVPDEPPSDRLSAIRANPGVIVGDPDELVTIDWSDEWDPDQGAHQ